MHIPRTHPEVPGHRCGVSPLTSTWDWGSNSGHQDCAASTLPAEPSCQLQLPFKSSLSSSVVLSKFHCSHFTGEQAIILVASSASLDRP